MIDAGLIPPLLTLLDTADFEIRKEVAWAICNATSSGDSLHIQYLVQSNCLKPLANLLSCNDNKIVIIVIEGLENILKVGESLKSQFANQNPYVL